MGPGHPRYTGASTEEGRGWPDVTSSKTTYDNKRQDTRKLQDKRACNDQVLTEPVRETGDSWRVVKLRGRIRCRLIDRIEVERSRIIKKIALDEINQEKINHETDHIKISQNQYTDKAVDVTVVIEEIATQIQNNAQKDSEKKTQQGDLSWTSDTVNVQDDV